MAPDFVIKRGDRRPVLSAILRDVAGTPLSLAGTTVRFHMTSYDGETDISGDVTVASPPEAGEVQYDWGASDTAIAGIYFGEFEITYSGGAKMTVPNTRSLVIHVVSDIG